MKRFQMSHFELCNPRIYGMIWYFSLHRYSVFLSLSLAGVFWTLHFYCKYFVIGSPRLRVLASNLFKKKKSFELLFFSLLSVVFHLPIFITLSHLKKTGQGMNVTTNIINGIRTWRSFLPFYEWHLTGDLFGDINAITLVIYSRVSVPAKMSARKMVNNKTSKRKYVFPFIYSVISVVFYSVSFSEYPLLSRVYMSKTICTVFLILSAVLPCKAVSYRDFVF